MVSPFMLAKTRPTHSIRYNGFQLRLIRSKTLNHFALYQKLLTNLDFFFFSRFRI